MNVINTLYLGVQNTLSFRITQLTSRFKFVYEILRDIIPTTIRYVIPNVIKWMNRRYFSQTIEALPITSPGQTPLTATLYFHGKDKIIEANECSPILWLHGDCSHPFTTLHLEGVSNLPMFSLNVPYRDDGSHIPLLVSAIDKMKEIVESKGVKFTGVIAGGHSRGAVELNALDDPRIKARISIAGIFKSDSHPSLDCEYLKYIMPKIETVLKKNPDAPICQIAVKGDWAIPTQVEYFKEKDLLILDGENHLGSLYSPKALAFVGNFIRAL